MRDADKEQKITIEELYEKENLWEKEDLLIFVIEQLEAGVDKETISQKLVEKGVDKNEATRLVEIAQTHFMEVEKEERLTTDLIVRGLVGGVLAALVGGCIWSLIIITIKSKIEFIIATGLLCVLCRFGVVLFARGKKGFLLEIIAILSSAMGIIIGKYFTFFHHLREEMMKRYGEEAAAKISILSERVIRLFGENIGLMFSRFEVCALLLVLVVWLIYIRLRFT